MKKVFTFLLAAFFIVSIFAQSPEKMSYQAVVRNSINALVTDTQIGMQISILQSSANGTAVYVETQTPTTNANGLVSIEIGAGTVESGDFITIDWANGPYFIKTETDLTGGTSFTITGTSQLLSVPYALHAKTAETVTGTITEADPIYTGSEAINITVTDITNLGNLSGINTGDQDLSGLPTTADLTTGLDLKVDKVQGKGLSTNNYSNVEKNKLAAISGTNTGDQDLSPLATKTALGDSTAQLRSEIPDVNGFISNETDPKFTSSEAANITAADITNLGNLSGVNTGDQNISGISINTQAIQDTASQIRADIPDVSGFLSTETDPEFTNSHAANITLTDITNLGNLSGVNTGDQNISGIATNAAAISDEVARATAAEGTNAGDILALEAGQTTQDAAIALNTAKTGITAAQATAITDNTSDISTLQSEQTTQNAAIAANTAKVGVTPGTVAGQMQYWNGTAWVAVVPTPNEGATLQMIGGVPTWVGGTPPPPVKGDSYQGGVVFYILQSGDPGYVDGETHGLIAATSNQQANWWNGSYVVTGATATTLGTGSANTTLIISAQGNTGTYAAKLCADYSVTVDGVTYDDWYLPSHDELYKFYLARSVVPGFYSASYYWSSSEADTNYAWWLNTYPTYLAAVDKKWSYAVRAIRSF